jgi:predicted MFS family arabinose efflux permease
VRATAIVFSGISIALVLGVPTGAFIGSIVGWRWAFALLAALCAAAGVLLTILVPHLPSERAFSYTDLRELSGQLRLRKVLLITALVVIGNYTAYTYVAPLLQEQHHINAGLVGTFLLSYGLAGVIGNFAAGAIMSRSHQARTVLVVLAITLTAALILLALTQSRLMIAALMAVWGAAYSAMPVILQTLVLRSGASQTGAAASSIYVLVFNCSIASGALFGGVAIDNFGSLIPVLTGAAFFALGAIAILRLRERTVAQ